MAAGGGEVAALGWPRGGGGGTMAAEGGGWAVPAGRWQRRLRCDSCSCGGGGDMTAMAGALTLAMTMAAAMAVHATIEYDATCCC